MGRATTSRQDARCARARRLVRLGDTLPRIACLAAMFLVLFSLSLILGPQEPTYDHAHNARTCSICSGRPLLGLRSFGGLVLGLSVVMLTLKHQILPRVVAPGQFEAGFCLGKYYGFGAQILYHCVLAVCFLVASCTRSPALYHVATLAEPAYCTLDVLLLLCTGVSFTHWQALPLLVHHTISCACTHALMYGLPESIFGLLLQLVFHASSAVCLGIANAQMTPSLKLTSQERLSMQSLSLEIWALTRVCFVFCLALCLLSEAAQLSNRHVVMVELSMAHLGSFAFVILKTPILTHALREAMQDYISEHVHHNMHKVVVALHDVEIGLQSSQLNVVKVSSCAFCCRQAAELLLVSIDKQGIDGLKLSAPTCAILRKAGWALAAEEAPKEPVVAEGAPKESLAIVKAEEVGNLVADDEWLGLGIELGIVLRSAVRESIKGRVRDFIGKDSYEFGDLSKEADARVKAVIADMRGKENYELGDLTLALDNIVKDEVCRLSGKDPGEYEMGDLSKEIDRRVKVVVADFCGKETYEPGDLTREVQRRVSNTVADFTGKEDYTFGDITRELNNRRTEWMKSYLGKEDYQFGDITKKVLSDFTGKEDFTLLRREVTKDSAETLSLADDIYIEELRKTGHYDKIGQADWYDMPHDVLARISNRIINEVSKTIGFLGPCA
ncbi:unnamed protein product [Symbiodinium natans]|uniref:Uncharacterized protein n=1 Tax=Symbiodinium natans TaxID=878477 RepID=A0A812RNJ2_9DINO|nr:unnamed protein product [Symbiodinium natans]